MTMIETTLRHLEALVSFDTRNPPRDIGTGGIFDYLRSQLDGFRIEVTDHGAGAVSMLAVRGNPTRLFNVHLDTVPSSEAWSANPHKLRVTEGRATGLGACDIKGAAAGLLVAATATKGDAAFLFSTDEEANDARCIAAFLARNHGFREAIIAEPTNCEAVLAHRGIASVLMKFRGSAGHASGANALQASALHNAMRWGNAALEFVESQSHQRFGGLTGLRFNIGRVEGGIKANMIAPSAEVRFGFRPLPSMPIDALHGHFRTLPGSNALVERPRILRSHVPWSFVAERQCRECRATPPRRARPGRFAGTPHRQRGGLLDRSLAVLGSRSHCLRLRPGRHRAGAYRRRVGVAGTTQHLHNIDYQDPRLNITVMNDARDIQTRQTIVRLLSSMASAKEISQYLKRFSQLDAKRFAVVKVGGAVLRDDLDALTSSLAFLQDVGLTPIVIHGAGPQLDEELSAAGIVRSTVCGLLHPRRWRSCAVSSTRRTSSSSSRCRRSMRARLRSSQACSKPSTWTATLTTWWVK
jgi:acetylornithine deacetylase